MSKTSTTYISANVSGDQTSENVGPLSNSLTSSPAQHTYITINSGNNTIQIPQLPSPAQYVLLIPPTSSSVNKWLMASGDATGCQISSTLQSLVGLSPAITSFVLRASGSETMEIWFF